MKQIIEITAEKELKELEIKRINKLGSYCSKLPFENIIPSSYLNIKKQDNIISI